MILGFLSLKYVNGKEAKFELILTGYKGFDPEVSSNGGLADRTAGVDYGAYPSSRTLLLGVNLKL